MGFSPDTKAKIKRAMLKIMKDKASEIEAYGRYSMGTDIKERQAIDTQLLLGQSLISRSKITSDSALFQFGVKSVPYAGKNPTPANYTGDTAPTEPAPELEQQGLGNTINAAIAVIWGIGPHRRNGPRNFPRVAINKIIVKYFGDLTKLKRK